jgi:hypothetical protein
VSPFRIALLGGPVFFMLWFVGAQILYFARGGTTDGGPLPGPSEYPEVALSNRSGIHTGATLLVVAAAALLWFAAGLRHRLRSKGGVGLVAALAAAGVAMLLILEAALVVASVDIAEETPGISWAVYQLSVAVGFESFITTVLGAVTVTAVIATLSRDVVSKWFWWFTAVVGVVLTTTGILEALGIFPNGRFAIFFGLWAFVAGFALFADAEASHRDSSSPSQAN